MNGRLGTNVPGWEDLLILTERYDGIVVHCGLLGWRHCVCWCLVVYLVAAVLDPSREKGYLS